MSILSHVRCHLVCSCFSTRLPVLIISVLLGLAAALTSFSQNMNTHFRRIHSSPLRRECVAYTTWRAFAILGAMVNSKLGGGSMAVLNGKSTLKRLL